MSGVKSQKRGKNGRAGIKGPPAGHRGDRLKKFPHRAGGREESGARKIPTYNSLKLFKRDRWFPTQKNVELDQEEFNRTRKRDRNSRLGKTSLWRGGVAGKGTLRRRKGRRKRTNPSPESKPEVRIPIPREGKGLEKDDPCNWKKLLTKRVSRGILIGLEKRGG